MTYIECKHDGEGSAIIDSFELIYLMGLKLIQLHWI
jgi:hypothetical protein